MRLPVRRAGVALASPEARGPTSTAFEPGTNVGGVIGNDAEAGRAPAPYR